MAEPTSPPSKMRISQLYTYPIKSLRGCTPPSVTATPSGFAHDRSFMLIRASDSKNMHVTGFPEMCLFTTELTPIDHPTKVVVRYTKDHVFDRPEDKVEDEPLEVELTPDYKDCEAVKMEMHSSGTVGYALGGRSDEWFSKRFGYAVRLLYLGDSKRKVLGNLSPNVAQAKKEDDKTTTTTGGWLNWTTTAASNVLGNLVSGSTDTTDDEYRGVDNGINFADCAPFLVINTLSFEDASSRLDDPLDISKFRANIILSGASSAFEEDYWAELHITSSKTNSESRIMLTSNCARCASLNVDYETGKPGTGDSGAILKKLQKDRRVDKGAKWSPIFGRYGFLAQKPGDVAEVKLEVGDTVEVVRRNAERTRFQWPKLSTDG